MSIKEELIQKLHRKRPGLPVHGNLAGAGPDRAAEPAEWQVARLESCRSAVIPCFPDSPVPVDCS